MIHFIPSFIHSFHQVQANNDLFGTDDDLADDVPTLPPPKMAITIKSKDVLETTITKTCLEVLGNLGKVSERSCRASWETCYYVYTKGEQIRSLAECASL